MKKKLLLWDNPCQAIYMLMFILLMVGCVNVFSASFIMAQDLTNDSLYFLGRYFMFAASGLVLVHIARQIGYKRALNRNFLWLCYMLVLAMLLAVHFTGEETKGAARWLRIGSFSIQPSEIAKLVIVMMASRYLGKAMKLQQEIKLLTGDCASVTYATMVIAVLVVIQPDLGTAAIIVALMMGLFIIAGLSKLWVLGLLGAGGVGAIILTITSPYRLGRIKVWLDPWLEPEGRGYQMVQSLLAIGSGGFGGTNWGQAAGKFFYLPEAHTDFAFAIFCQENGFVGAMLLLLAFSILAIAFFQITISTRDNRGFLLGAGVTFLIIGQAFANMAMVCGLLPVIGVPLIFISYGGTSMWISMIAIGLLLSVYDEEQKQRQIDAQPPEKRRENLRVVRSGRIN